MGTSSTTLDSIATCSKSRVFHTRRPNFRSTRILIWTSTLQQSTLHGTRSMTLLTITCLGTVPPVSGGTRAMTIIRNLVAAHVLERHHGSRNSNTQIDLSHPHNASVSPRGSSGSLTNTCSETSYASQWWYTCDDEGPYSFSRWCVH